MIDTLQFTKEAVAAGLTQEQAEFHARWIDKNVITPEVLKNELDEFEGRMQSFQLKLLGLMLTGTMTIISVVQTVYHLIK